jgi:AcrR family transcriptional regulator
MASFRLRPAGFDARPWRPSSLRAEAQRVYRASAPLAPALQQAATPTPNPSPQGGREQAACAAGETCPRGAEQITELTRRIRALYEDSVVPVAEIARIAGVNQRTLYRYVEKGDWRRRHATQDIAAAVRKRAAKRKPRPCVTLKGAGGRFIRNADAGKPVRRGLKALDPMGEARALTVAAKAAKLAEAAVARTQRRRETMTNVRMLNMLLEVARDLAAVEDAMREDNRAAPSRRPGRKPWRPMLSSG